MGEILGGCQCRRSVLTMRSGKCRVDSDARVVVRFDQGHRSLSDVGQDPIGVCEPSQTQCSIVLWRFVRVIRGHVWC